MAVVGVSTKPIFNVTKNSALSGGQLRAFKGYTIYEEGICYSKTNPIPTISDPSTNDGVNMETYQSKLLSLDASPHYYVRAFVGSSYTPCLYANNVVEFDTLDGDPVRKAVQMGGQTLVAGGQRVIFKASPL